MSHTIKLPLSGKWVRGGLVEVGEGLVDIGKDLITCLFPITTQEKFFAI